MQSSKPSKLWGSASPVLVAASLSLLLLAFFTGSIFCRNGARLAIFRRFVIGPWFPSALQQELGPKLPPGGPVLFVVVRVMPHHIRNLPVLLFSLLSAQKRRRVQIVLVRTYDWKPGNDAGVEDAASLVNMMVSGESVSVSPLSDIDARALFPNLRPDPKLTWARDAGYILTDLVIGSLLEHRIKERSGGCATDAFLVTNGDNLYASGFVDAIDEAITNGADLTATYFSSHYEWTEEKVSRARQQGHGPLRTGLDPEVLTSPGLRIGGVDLGAVVMRADLLQQSGRRFVLDRLKHDPVGGSIDFLQADGELFESLANLPNVHVTIVPRLLFLHQ